MDKQKVAVESPAEVLAARITANLVEKKLIHEGDAKKMQSSMLTGKMKASDWRLVVENAIEKEKHNGK